MARRKLCSISVQPSTRRASSSAASPEVKSAVNPGGLADPLLESAETAIALHLVLEWSPCLPQRSVLAPKARRSKSRRRGNRKCACCPPPPSAEVSAKTPDCEPPTASKDRVVPARRFPSWSVEELDAGFVVKDSTGQKLVHVYF